MLGESSPEHLLSRLSSEGMHLPNGRFEFRSSFAVFLDRYLVEAAGKPFVAQFKWRGAPCSSGWCVEWQIDSAHHAAMSAA
jgi:hypothetical protein